MHPVVAEDGTQVRERRQIVLSVVFDDPRVGGVEPAVILVERQHLYLVPVVVYGETDAPLLLPRPFGHPEQQSRTAAEAEDTGIEQADYLHPVNAGTKVGRSENGIFRKPFCNIHMLVYYWLSIITMPYRKVLLNG